MMLDIPYDRFSRGHEFHKDPGRIYNCLDLLYIPSTETLQKVKEGKSICIVHLLALIPMSIARSSLYGQKALPYRIKLSSQNDPEKKINLDYEQM